MTTWYDSLTLNSYDLTNAALHVMAAPISAIPDFDTTQFRLPWATGSRAEFSGVKPKVLTFECMVTASTEAAKKAYLDILFRKLYAARNVDVSIQLNAMTDRYWMGRYVGGLEALHHGRETVRFSLSFLCPDPRMFSTTETTVNTTITSAAHTLSITPGGNAPIEPVFYLWVPSTVTGEISIAHAASGSTLKLRDTGLTQWYWLKVDCAQRTQTVYLGTLVGVNPDMAGTAYASITDYTASMTEVFGPFPYLLPGDAQNIIISGLVNNAKCYTVYREQYWL